ncbi:MAG: tRNA (adenosine(37)-N6)-dimethylallyltransferase MiaA [Acidimicrobiia bacterium]
MIEHLALVGPTASGKTSLALRYAAAHDDVEIVSMDSMQVYRGMDVGTAKATPEERAHVPHHLIDVCDPSEEWSVARFQTEARAAVADIAARGKRALLVGGTGLYVQAVVDPMTFPPEDRNLRAELEAEAEAPGGLARISSELEAADPEAAARIEPGNVRRIVRALEVIRLTGRPFSSFGPGIQDYGPTVFPVRMVGVWLPRDELNARIDARLGAMPQAGFVEEVEDLRASPQGLSRTAAQAIGYQEVLAHLAGERTLNDALAAAATRTRQFARRQRMWFRRDPRISWIAGAGDERWNPDVLTPVLLAKWEQ